MKRLGVAVFALGVLTIAIGGFAGLASGMGGENAQLGVQPDVQQQTDGSTGASPTTISVSVSNTTVDEGKSITTTDNPTITITADSDEEITHISLRVDGEIRHRYAPNSTSATESTALDLKPGEHVVKIVAKTDQSTTSSTITVVEDSTKPRMVFESPFSTDGMYDDPENEYILNESAIQLNATLHDISSVERVVIRNRYSYENTEGESNLKKFVIDDPGDSISKSIRLGPGKPKFDLGQNRMQITLVDSFGHRNTYEMEIFVQDIESPEIEILDRTAVKNRQAVRVDIRATDNVGIKSLGTRMGNAQDQGVDYRFYEEPTGSRPLEYEFSKTVPVPNTTAKMTVVAVDGFNNVSTRSVTLDYGELVSPEIHLDNDSITAVGNKEIRVEGSVSEGHISSVYVETVDSSGEVVDLKEVYDGSPTESVQIDETLESALVFPELRVRTIDTMGNEQVQTISYSAPETEYEGDDNTTDGTDSTNETAPDSEGENGTDQSPPSDSSEDQSPYRAYLDKALNFASGLSNQVLAGMAGAVVVFGWVSYRIRG